MFLTCFPSVASRSDRSHPRNPDAIHTGKRWRIARFAQTQYRAAFVIFARYLMSAGVIADVSANKTAYIMADTGERITFGELEAESNRGAQLFRHLGLRSGDHIALMLENHPQFLKICWAAQRAGLYYTAISFR